MKIRKGYVFLALVLLVTGVMARYVFSDINLDVDLLRESLERMPAVVMENLEFEREIGEDLWQARIPQAKRLGSIVEVQSPDVVRRLADGKKWYFKGVRGFYSETAESADVIDLLGTLETDSRVLSLDSPALSWSRGTGVFLFPSGVTLYDAEFVLESDLASIDASGVMTLDEGAVINWKRIAQ